MSTEIKSSIISIVPVKIKSERKGAMYPDTFEIPASIDDNPQILIVGDGFSRVYLGSGNSKEWVRTPILSSALAESIVADYLRSCICIKEGCEPGIFSVSNKEVKDVQKECLAQLIAAKARQLRWFEELIRTADDDWTKSGHRHNSISDLQRIIAKRLGLSKEWLFVTKDDLPSDMMKCPACREIIERAAVICSHCHLILKPEEHKKLQFVGA